MNRYPKTRLGTVARNENLPGEFQSSTDGSHEFGIAVYINNPRGIPTTIMAANKVKDGAQGDLVLEQSQGRKHLRNINLR